MSRHFTGYKKQDWIIALAIILVVFLIAQAHITRGMPNFLGGDFSAYITTGRAIAEGTFEEQAVLNHIMHPSPLPEEAGEGQLVYAWGYPLLLSLVYRLAGLDLTNYSTILFYKIPSLIALSLTAGILYLFYRRHFSRLFSLFLALVLPTSADLLTQLNYMYSDIVFMGASTLTLWMAETYFDAMSPQRDIRTSAVRALILGILFWMTYEIRLNGITIILAIAIAHLIRLFRTKPSWNPKSVLLNVAPYLLFFLLKVISEAILLPATSNTSDVGGLNWMQLLQNVKEYYALTNLYFTSLTGNNFPYLGRVMYLIILIGLLFHGLQWNNLHLTILLAGTYVVLIMMPYSQGFRYLYNVLPLILLFLGFGCQRVGTWAAKKLSVSERPQNLMILFAAVLCLIVLYTPVINTAAANIKNDRQVTETDIYSEEAIDMYRFIQDNTESNAVIAFQKPRILYFNTGRLSIHPHTNGHSLEEADYYLFSSVIHDGIDLELREDPRLKLWYENPSFSLYSVNK